MPARPNLNIIKYFLLFLIASAISLFLSKTVSAQVVINEFVPDASPEWIEFYNASDSAEFIKSYWLDDDTDFTSDSGSSAKKLLSGLDVSNYSYPFIEVNSFLNNSGDFVVLFDSSGVIIDQYQYTSNPGAGISIGRSPDKTGNFVTLTSPTKGSANSEPLLAPTLIPTSEPTNIPTPTPTPKPPTPTPKPPSPTTKPTPRPTPTPKLPTPTPDESLVLSASSASELAGALTPTPPESTPQVLGANDKKTNNFIPMVFIGLGVAFLGVSGAFLLIPKIRRYNNRTYESGETH